MSLIGKLRDISAIEILQILSLSKCTGVLTIESLHGKNNVVFKNGMIISASSPRAKSLGQILTERQLLSPARLEAFLDLQKQKGNQPLGSILLEAGVIQEESLRELIKDRIREALIELKSLSEGNFNFQSSEIIPFDDLHFSWTEALSESGWDPKHLLKEDAAAKAALKGKAIPFQALLGKHRVPVTDNPPVASEDLVPGDAYQTGPLPELEPPAGDTPEVAFDLIAEQIDFPVISPSSPFPSIAITGGQEAESFKTILLVDDEALIRQLMAKRMREKGCEVFQTENAKDALRMVRQMIANTADFSIITDLVMPTTSGSGFLGGLEFIEAVRKINTRIPILVMTDYDDLQAQTRAYALGVFEFHKKPVLSRSSVEETQTKMYHFTDTLLSALRQPPYLLDENIEGSDFRTDVSGKEKSGALPQSASNMMRHMSELQREVEGSVSSTEGAPEISQVILRYAADFFQRGLLFQLRKEEAIGITGFGETGDIESMPQKARRMRISLQNESIFARVLRQKSGHVGKLADTPANRQFISLTGRLIPPEIAMLPLICKDEVIGFLYADNALSRKPIRGLEPLEIFLAQAGMAVEHAALRDKTRTITLK